MTKVLSIKERVDKLLKEQKRILNEIDKIREECHHLNYIKKYGSNTGNYDPSTDCRWVDFWCLDCGKRWTEY